MSVELVRVPCERQNPHGYRTPKYDYVTADGRWRVEKDFYICGGPAWRVIDTTGQYRMESWWGLMREAAQVRTLESAKAFIAEWSV
jgi:hypothetical protein